MNRSETPCDTSSQSLGSSFRNAGLGLLVLCRDERNFRIHLIFAVLSIVLGLALNISQTQWGVLLLSIGLVLTAEAINSSIEAVVDLVEPQLNPVAARAKDIAAAAVTIAAFISVTIGILLFVPPIWNSLSS